MHATFSVPGLSIDVECLLALGSSCGRDVLDLHTPLLQLLTGQACKNRLPWFSRHKIVIFFLDPIVYKVHVLVCCALLSYRSCVVIMMPSRQERSSESSRRCVVIPCCCP
jgi:hypothetical protein